MIASLFRHARLLVAPAGSRPSLTRVQLKDHGDAINLRYSGSAETLNFLTALLFQAPGVATDAAPGLAAPDLIITERSPLSSAVHPARAPIRAPAWISQRIALRYGDDPHALFSRHLRREVERQTRRHGYRLELRSDEAGRRTFYHDLYRPYVQARFAGQAIAVSEDTFLQRSAGQMLACLHTQSTWVAGMLLKTQGAQLRFGWFGALSDPPPPGASEVLDAAVIRWAAGRGLREVVLGHSRPSWNDGVLRYKRRFGAQVRATPFPQPRIDVEVPRPSAALAAALDAASLIRIEQGQPRLHRVRCERGRLVVELEPCGEAHA